MITSAPALSPVQWNVPLAIPFTTAGGSGNGLQWSLSEGSTLPEGLHLDADGLLSGLPIKSGDYTFTLAVHDDCIPSNSAWQTFQFSVQSPVIFTSTQLPTAVAGSPYGAAVPAQSTFTPVTYATVGFSQYISDQPGTFTETGQRQPWTADENEWILDFGFPFIYFGATYESCRVGDNGYLVLGDASPNPKWDATVEKFEKLTIIAPFWSDLIIDVDHPGAGIYVERGDGWITVRWCGLDYHYVEGTARPQPPLDDTDAVNVSVTLWRNGDIRFSYGSLQTSNRAIVGLCGGSTELLRLYASHSWTPAAPDYMTDWNQHGDILISNLPTWLTLSPDGVLHGTPAAPATWPLTFQAADGAGNTATQAFIITVVAPDSADTNLDGDVDDAEILRFIEFRQSGVVTDAQVAAAVAAWRSGPRRSGEDAESAAPPLPVRRRQGEILVVRISDADAGQIALFAAEGFDISGVWPGGAVELYVTDTEYSELVSRGLAPVITAVQHVGDAGVTAAPDQRGAGYHTYSALTATLSELAAAWPQITRLVSIGESVQGRQLWALLITDRPDFEENEPAVRFNGGIHGDEPPSVEMCLSFARYLLEGYAIPGPEGDRIRALVNSTKLWVLPCSNPDGFEARTRYNANGVDLNRSFPDGVISDIGAAWFGNTAEETNLEPETAAFMRWCVKENFSLGASLHTGSLLVCYPYGNNAAAQTAYTAAPDDALLRYLASLYAGANSQMLAGSPYPGGIVNAAAWYPVTGELADWAYRYLGTQEITVELFQEKTPSSTVLPQLWEWNRESMLALAESARQGVHGAVSGAAFPGAVKISLATAGTPSSGHRLAGDFHRFLMPGSWTVEVAAPGYVTQERRAVPVQAATSTWLNVELAPAADLVRRQLCGTGYLAGNQISAVWSIELAEPPPPAFILRETLPRGWSYVSGSTAGADGSALAEPRQADGSCSWLFWGDAARDTLFTASLTVDPARGGHATLDGCFQTPAYKTPVTGNSALPQATMPTAVLRLERGWNLVSFPIFPAAETTAAFFATIPETPIIWSWDRDGYRQPPALLAKDGYWIYMRAPYSILYSGSEAGDSLHFFSSGWNLFGPLRNRGLLVRDYLQEQPMFYADGCYVPAVSLRQGSGYWIYSSSDSTRTVDLNE